MFLIVKFLTAP